MWNRWPQNFSHPGHVVFVGGAVGGAPARDRTKTVPSVFFHKMEEADVDDDAVAGAAEQLEKMDIGMDAADVAADVFAAELAARAAMAKDIAKQNDLDLKDAKYVCFHNASLTWRVGDSKGKVPAAKHFQTKEEACLYFLLHVKPELDKNDGKLTKEQCKELYAAGDGEVADHFAAKKQAAKASKVEAAKAAAKKEKEAAKEAAKAAAKKEKEAAKIEAAKKEAAELGLDLFDKKVKYIYAQPSGNWRLGDSTKLPYVGYFDSKEEAALYFLKHIYPEMYTPKNGGQLTKEQVAAIVAENPMWNAVDVDISWLNYPVSQ